MQTLSMAFTLFLLMDSIGNIPLFISNLKGIPQTRQLRIILRELLIALSTMVFFNYLGDIALSSLHISQYSILISGGVILFLLSLKMIFPPKEADPPLMDAEPFIVPLAIPLVAGPAVLATIILYSQQPEGSSLLAILLAWGASALILLSSAFLNKILGKRGISSCERLMGLIMIMLSVEMLLNGITAYINKCSF